MFFDFSELDHLPSVRHVISTVVEDLHSEETLLELALCINGVFDRVLGHNVEVFIKDSITVEHSLVGVNRLFYQLLKLFPLLALLVVEKELFGLI